MAALIKACSVKNGPQRQPNCHSSAAVEAHPLPAPGDTETCFLRWRSCYDSHGCVALGDTALVPAARCHVIGPPAGPAPEFPRVSTPPLFINRWA